MAAGIEMVLHVLTEKLKLLCKALSRQTGVSIECYVIVFLECNAKADPLF